MSELMNSYTRRVVRRWLLSTASAFAFIASAYVMDEANAADDDADHPTLWIELGGDLQHVGGQGEPFMPAFIAANPSSPVLKPSTPIQAQNPPPFQFGEEGKISFQPEGSDWVFSASVLYGRSSNFKKVDHQTNRVLALQYPYTPSKIYKTDLEDFANTQVHRRESHAVLDFAVGKDVGLGLFGKEGLSSISLGVRFAQFSSDVTFDAKARPDLHVNSKYNSFLHRSAPQSKYFHTYHATGRASRSFRGIGPSLSWNNSTPIMGNPRNGEIALDWGANAALLFGRQKARVQHQESAHYKSKNVQQEYTTTYQHPPAGHSAARERSPCRMSAVSRVRPIASRISRSILAIARISSLAQLTAASTRANPRP